MLPFSPARFGNLAAMGGGEITPGAFDYLRPDGTSYFKRPGGTNYYTRP